MATLSVYTPAQAAVITGLSLRSVRKAIDGGLVPSTARNQGNRTLRYLSEAALVCLHLESSGLSLFPPATRQALMAEVMRSPRLKHLHPSSIVTVDLRPSRRFVSRAVRLLRRIESMVSEDPAVMSGAPVFKGTRVPVHQIAFEVESGATLDEILADYPSITREQTEMALLYAKAHPRTGRPAVRPRTRPVPVKVIRRVIANIRDRG